MSCLSRSETTGSRTNYLYLFYAIDPGRLGSSPASVRRCGCDVMCCAERVKRKSKDGFVEKGKPADCGMCCLGAILHYTNPDRGMNGKCKSCLFYHHHHHHTVHTLPPLSGLV